MDLLEFGLYYGVTFFVGWAVFEVLKYAFKTIYDATKYLLNNKW